jgi:hypothetical protein
VTTKQKILPQSDGNAAVASRLRWLHLSGRTAASICTKEKAHVLLPIGGGDIHWSRRLIEVFGRRRSHWCATDLIVPMLMVRVLDLMRVRETLSTGISPLAGRLLISV